MSNRLFLEMGVGNDLYGMDYTKQHAEQFKKLYTTTKLVYLSNWIMITTT